VKVSEMHTRVSHAHARPLYPAALAFVSYGVVLAEFELELELDKHWRKRPFRFYVSTVLQLLFRARRCFFSVLPPSGLLS